MPRPCSICEHPNHEEIDQELLGGGVYRDIARRYRVSKDATFRHKKDHLPIAMVEAKVLGQERYADDLVAQVLKLQQKAERILESAEAEGKPLVALTAVRELRELIKLQGFLLGQLWQQKNIHIDQVVVHQEWQHIQLAIIGALADFPEAREAVQQALEGALHEPA